MATTPKKKTADDKKGRFVTPVFRMSFPTLFVPKAYEDDPDGTKKFSVTAIWLPNEIEKAAKKPGATPFAKLEWKRYQKILSELDRVSNEKFGTDWDDLPSKVKHKGLRDGDEKEGLDGFPPGSRFANLATIGRPGVVGPTIDEETEKFYVIGPEHDNASEIYSGCYGRATVNIWGFDKKSKGLAFGLFNVQKLKEGKRLDNRVKAEDDFDEDIDADWLDEADEGGGDADDADDDFG